MASLRQGPNLRRKLCKATLPKLSRNPTRATHRNTAGWKRCSTTTGRQCPVCPLTPTSATSITSHLTNYTHTLTHSMNCKTEIVICGNVQNVATILIQIGAPTHTMSPTMKALYIVAWQHFFLPGHSFHHLQGLAIEKVISKDPFILKAREAWLIKKFDCYRNGLNKEPWSLKI